MKKKKIEFRSTCPISTALDIFGDKWSLLVMRDLIFNNKSTYGEFMESDEGIASNILADRLALLESANIITKHTHPESKAKVLYKLTQKGLDLIPLLIEIILWSEKYHIVHPYSAVFSKRARQNKAKVIAEVYAQHSK